MDQAIDHDSNAISDGGSNANSGGRSSGSDTRQAIGRDPNANSGGDSDSNSGGESSAVDTQQVVSQDSNANSGGQSEANASRLAALEERGPPARQTSRRAGVYDIDTSTSIHHFRERYDEAAARVKVADS
jgi:hypothetical protein